MPTLLTFRPQIPVTVLHLSSTTFTLQGPSARAAVTSLTPLALPLHLHPAGTFTKSFGSCGGYIAGSHELIRFLRRHGPAHLYAAALSPPAAQQILSAIKLIDGEDGTTRGRDKVRLGGKGAEG